MAVSCCLWMSGVPCLPHHPSCRAVLVCVTHTMALCHGQPLTTMCIVQPTAACGQRPADAGACQPPATSCIWKWSRAKGKAAWANKVPQLFLTSNREPSEEAALNAARGIVISKERRDRRWPDVLRLSQAQRAKAGLPMAVGQKHGGGGCQCPDYLPRRQSEREDRQAVQPLSSVTKPCPPGCPPGCRQPDACRHWRPVARPGTSPVRPGLIFRRPSSQ